VATVISLREIIEAMEIQRDDCVSYLDPDTGEVISVTEEERRLVERGFSRRCSRMAALDDAKGPCLVGKRSFP